MQKTLTRTLGAWCAALLTGIALILAALPAHAHDVLVDSTPELGASLETTPSEVRLQFSGKPLDGQGLQNLIRVTDAQGNQWQDEQLTVEGFELAVPLCQGLPQGEYTVAYRVIYSDGHTGEEHFDFTNADPNAPDSGTPEDCGEAVAQESTPQEVDPSNESQDTSNAPSQVDDKNASSSFPTWIWFVGGLGIIVVAGIVFLLLRGSRTDDSSPGGHND